MQGWRYVGKVCGVLPAYTMLPLPQSPSRGRHTFFKTHSLASFGESYSGVCGTSKRESFKW